MEKSGRAGTWKGTEAVKRKEQKWVYDHSAMHSDNVIVTFR